MNLLYKAAPAVQSNKFMKVKLDFHPPPSPVRTMGSLGSGEEDAVIQIINDTHQIRQIIVLQVKTGELSRGGTSIRICIIKL